MSEANVEVTKPLETESDRPTVVVASSTFYKTWYPGNIISEKDVDKLRGDLAIESLGKAVSKGYRVIDIDGGSSEDFREALIEKGVQVVDQEEPGYSASRRQGNTLASEYNPKVIFSVEPEKPSLMDSIDLLAQPILDGKADIVFAKRDKSAFDNYPPVQAEFEQKSNKLANDILRKHGLLSEDSPDLDWWMGPRMIRNDPQILDLFEKKYDFRKFDGPIDKTINLELWPNTLYLPVVAALAKGLRVVSVPVKYIHPEIMTRSETGLKEFDRKREVQFKGIIIAMIEAVRKIELESGISTKPTRLQS